MNSVEMDNPAPQFAAILESSNTLLDSEVSSELTAVTLTGILLNAEGVYNDAR
jgi:hypothetical protein